MSAIAYMLQSFQGHNHYFEIDRKVDGKWLSVCRTCGEVHVTNGCKSDKQTPEDYTYYAEGDGPE